MTRREAEQILEKQSVSISKNNNYTEENVRLAINTLNENNGKRYPDWELIINTYNTIKGTNASLSDCKSCGADKYITFLKQFAKYGRIVMESQGIDLSIKTNKKEDEINPNRIVGVIEEDVDDKLEPSKFTEEDWQEVRDEITEVNKEIKKRGRKSNK